MEHDTKTEKRSDRTRTPPNPFYTPIDNGSEDLTEVPILPETLGLHFWLFRRGLVFALLRDDYDKIKNYAALYEKRHNKQLIGLRLENHPLVLSRDGVNPGIKQTLKNFRFETLEK